MNEAENICLELQTMINSDYFNFEQLFDDLLKINEIINYYKFMQKKGLIAENDYESIENNITNALNNSIKRLSIITLACCYDEAYLEASYLIKKKQILFGKAIEIENNISYFNCVLKEIESSIKFLIGHGNTIQTYYSFSNCHINLSIYSMCITYYNDALPSKKQSVFNYENIKKVIYDNNKITISDGWQSDIIATNDSSDLELFILAHWLRALIERKPTGCIFIGNYIYKYKVPANFTYSRETPIPNNNKSTKTMASDNTSTNSKKGCFIATCIYGSYDCPEVWRLRRYRDNYLDKSIIGRLFIKLYYCISPKIVKMLGKKKWFKKLCKGILDKKMKKLKEKGYDNTPYKDKY